MNNDTGEIRRMTQDERNRLNQEAGRELWTPISEGQAQIVQNIATMEHPSAIDTRSRKVRRADARNRYGCSLAEAKRRGLA